MAKVSRETFAVQATGRIDTETGAIVPPVHLATTFERGPDNSYPTGYVYGRPDNATVRDCETVITELELGAGTLLFGSGMAAATAAFLALERPAHVVVPEVMYWGLRKWLKTDAPSHGITSTFVDGSNLEATRAAIRAGETRLVWVETPANPLWTITDITAVAEIAHAAGAVVAVDSTAATPVLSQPLTLGADIVMHSATKYLNGHSDVLAGALAFATMDELAERAATLRGSLGAICGPFEASLLLRGMRTLFVRVRQQSLAAMTIAQELEGNPLLSQVLYPGLSSHPGHELARRQMPDGFGGMLSIRCSGGEAHAVRTAANLQIWKRATSLGGVESLVEHRASIEGLDSPCPPDLLRLSTGLEPAAELVADLIAALKQAS